MDPEPLEQPRVLGRYVLCQTLASGGMATVYLGRLVGSVGFRRVVAIKAMHPALAKRGDLLRMFVDEARLASRIQHPNVVTTLDVIQEAGDVFIVMEYVRGESLAGLLRSSRARGSRVPVPIAVGVACGVLEGLHAAHEARGEDGELLQLVHRDVSPHNVLVGADGLARIMDFGVAKATNRLAVTRNNELKGKLPYIAPEQLMGGEGLDRRGDLYAMGVVVWEMLAGRRLIEGPDFNSMVAEVLVGQVPPLAEFRDDVPAALEAAIRRALDRDLDARFATAKELALALETAALQVATARAIGAWVADVAADVLVDRQRAVAAIETQAAAPGPVSEPGARSPAVGTTVAGKYRLERSLASGSRGTIWVARHVTLDVPVAIKFLREELTTSAATARFQREARAAARLKGEHVVQVLDHGVEPSGRRYIVMELLQGEDLETRLQREKQLSLSASGEILRQVAEGLAGAHDAGIVHRDLKPTNLFLVAGAGGTETVKILDFGLATALADESAALTATGMLLGSPEYMSPEQIHDPRSVDLRSDLWSLGAILFRMITGQRPFGGLSVKDALTRVGDVPPPVPSQFSASVPPEIDRFFMRALARKPDARFESAQQMARVFSDLVSRQDARSESAQETERTTPVSRRALAVAAGCAVVVAGLGAARPWRWASGPESGVVTAPATGDMAAPAVSSVGGPVPDGTTAEPGAASAAPVEPAPVVVPPRPATSERRARSPARPRQPSEPAPTSTRPDWGVKRKPD